MPQTHKPQKKFSVTVYMVASVRASGSMAAKTQLTKNLLKFISTLDNVQLDQVKVVDVSEGTNL